MSKYPRLPMERTERLIEMIRMLQEFEGTNSELRKELEISNSTLEGDKRALRTGVNLLGWDIKLNLRTRENTYGKSQELEDSRFHPLFFCLNTTEVYALLAALEKSPHTIIADRLKSLLYRQLSDSGKDALREFKPELTLGTYNEDLPLEVVEQSKLYTEKNLDLFFLKPKYEIEVELKGGHFFKGRLENVVAPLSTGPA